MRVSNIIIIKNDLIFPPSEISVFRDVTLYTKIYTGHDVVVESEPQHVDTCYKYLTSHGAFDYVDDIIRPGAETGVIISDTPPCTVQVRKFWSGNLDRILHGLLSVSH